MKDIQVNPIAEMIHQEMVYLNAHGNIDGAKDQYLLADIALEQYYPEPFGPSYFIHKSRLYRDRAFVAAKDTLVKNYQDESFEKEDLSIADHYAQKSFEYSEQVYDIVDQFDIESKRYAHSEIGATISMVGRLMVVKTVLDYEKTEEMDREQLEEAEEHFHWARNETKQGKNQYYRVSNALLAARAEALLDNSIWKKSLWKVVALDGITKAAIIDHGNLKPALGTYIKRRNDSKNRQTARESVWERP